MLGYNVTSKTPASKAVWLNAVLIPVKQHVVCCAILPMAATALGGGAAAEFMHSLPAEIAMGVTVPPLVTYGVMLAEQKWHERKHRRDGHGAQCSHKTLTRRNFFRQTALSYVMYAATAMLWPHEHEDHEHKVENTAVKTLHLN